MAIVWGLDGFFIKAFDFARNPTATTIEIFIVIFFGIIGSIC